MNIMDKVTTPLGELKKGLGKSINVPMKNVVKETAYLHVLAIINHHLLSREKQLIIDAYQAGYEAAFNHEPCNAKEYYQDTYDK